MAESAPGPQPDVGALVAKIRAELVPVYHVTPGGLKFSVAEDALRELVSIAHGGTDRG